MKFTLMLSLFASAAALAAFERVAGSTLNAPATTPAAKPRAAPSSSVPVPAPAPAHAPASHPNPTSAPREIDSHLAAKLENCPLGYSISLTDPNSRVWTCLVGVYRGSLREGLIHVGTPCTLEITASGQISFTSSSGGATFEKRSWIYLKEVKRNEHRLSYLAGINNDTTDPGILLALGGKFVVASYADRTMTDEKSDEAKGLFCDINRLDR